MKVTHTHANSAFIVSIIRQAYAGKVGSTADPTWDDVPAALVSVVELMAGFLAASIPTYRPLWRHIFSRGQRNSSSGGFGSSGREAGQWSDNNMKTQTKVSTGVGRAGTTTHMSQAAGGISVTRDIELSTQDMAGGVRHDEVWMRDSDEGSEDALRRIV